MLISFGIKNFLSFKNHTKFSMVSGSTKLKSDRLFKTDKFSLLKFSAIYGSNASGKSNLTKAMYCMRLLTLFGQPSRLLDMWYKLDEDSKNEATYFEVELNINNRNLSYGFEFLASQNKFVSEWLVDLDNNQQSIFERNITKGTFKLNERFNDVVKSKMEVYKDDLKKDFSKLFIKFVKEKEDVFKSTTLLLLIKVYDWFATDLIVSSPSDDITSPTYFRADKKLNELSNYLKKFDTGIDYLKCVDIDYLELQKAIPQKLAEKIQNDLYDEASNQLSDIMIKGDNMYHIQKKSGEIICQKIIFVHNNASLTLSDESDGTIRLMEILEVLLTKDEGKTYIIDELDRCLHPEITTTFVKEFLKKTLTQNIQLIVTTHESRLLTLKLLRRDEVWFTNKKDGVSSLYSLEQFNERFDKKIDKAYLDGRYGGVPIIQDFFSNP